MLMMDMHDSGGSTSSGDNFSANARACVASCSFGFQDFSSLRILYAAVTDHITEKVGCTARLDGVVCGFDDSDLLSHLPAALLGENSDHLGSGHLASVLRSPADLRAVADLYFGGDLLSKMGRECMIFDGLTV